MDYLRYCYTADCQFGTDPDVTRRIQWYRCQPTAKPLRYPHSFASEVWYGGEPYEGIGERPHLYTDWVDGSFPVVVPGTKVPCGDKEVMQHGWPGPDPPALDRYSFGLAKCCGIFSDPCDHCITADDGESCLKADDGVTCITPDARPCLTADDGVTCLTADDGVTIIYPDGV